MRDDTTHIVIHTAAWPGDPSVDDIRQSHLQRGFKDIGYHYVIRKNGNIETGRPEYQIGAHCDASDMDYKSVGICLSGHHDDELLTMDQLDSLASLVNILRRAYEIPIDNVIGHREAGANKTCPGTKIDMDQLRGFIQAKDISKVAKARLPESEDSGSHDYRPEGDYDGDGIKDTHEIPVTGAKPLDPEFYMGPGPRRKKFKETTFGRIVLGKNKGGKILYGVLGAGGSIYAGSWIEPVNHILQQIATGTTPLIPNIGGTMELEILDLILIALVAIITFVTTRGLISGTINEIAIEIKQVITALQAAREASSPGGKQITKEEQALILKEADDIAQVLWRKIIRSRILRWLGLDKSLFDGGRGTSS